MMKTLTMETRAPHSALADAVLGVADRSVRRLFRMAFGRKVGGLPAPDSAGPSPLGKKYLVGATLKCRSGGEDQTLDVSRPHSSLGKKTPDEAYAVMLPSVKLAV
ncbi:MAG: hypothetical protein Q8N54_14740 [Sulfurimicrobium sp.]|nr:hypothetical protein [Sulfurimicrobium sp.]